MYSTRKKPLNGNRSSKVSGLIQGSLSNRKRDENQKGEDLITEIKRTLQIKINEMNRRFIKNCNKQLNNCKSLQTIQIEGLEVLQNYQKRVSRETTHQQSIKPSRLNQKPSRQNQNNQQINESSKSRFSQNSQQQPTDLLEVYQSLEKCKKQEQKITKKLEKLNESYEKYQHQLAKSFKSIISNVESMGQQVWMKMEQEKERKLRENCIEEKVYAFVLGLKKMKTVYLVPQSSVDGRETNNENLKNKRMQIIEREQSKKIKELTQKGQGLITAIEAIDQQMNQKYSLLQKFTHQCHLNLNQIIKTFDRDNLSDCISQSTRKFLQSTTQQTQTQIHGVQLFYQTNTPQALDKNTVRRKQVEHQQVNVGSFSDQQSYLEQKLIGSLKQQRQNEVDQDVSGLKESKGFSENIIKTQKDDSEQEGISLIMDKSNYFIVPQSVESIRNEKSISELNLNSLQKTNSMNQTKKQLTLPVQAIQSIKLGSQQSIDEGLSSKNPEITDSNLSLNSLQLKLVSEVQLCKQPQIKQIKILTKINQNQHCQSQLQNIYHQSFAKQTPQCPTQLNYSQSQLPELNTVSHSQYMFRPHPKEQNKLNQDNELQEQFRYQKKGKSGKFTQILHKQSSQNIQRQNLYNTRYSSDSNPITKSNTSQISPNSHYQTNICTNMQKRYSQKRIPICEIPNCEAPDTLIKSSSLTQLPSYKRLNHLYSNFDSSFKNTNLILKKHSIVNSKPILLDDPPNLPFLKSTRTSSIDNRQSSLADLLSSRNMLKNTCYDSLRKQKLKFDKIKTCRFNQ